MWICFTLLHYYPKRARQEKESWFLITIVWGWWWLKIKILSRFNHHRLGLKPGKSRLCYHSWAVFTEMISSEKRSFSLRYCHPTCSTESRDITSAREITRPFPFQARMRHYWKLYTKAFWRRQKLRTTNKLPQLKKGHRKRESDYTDERITHKYFSQWCCSFPY